MAPEAVLGQVFLTAFRWPETTLRLRTHKPNFFTIFADVETLEVQN
ncbi:MAG TPA: hypothetical protein VFI95_24445 [Terriglobales bacterium]|nr:hypothetical protein [Terriglobales bacterium]